MRQRRTDLALEAKELWEESAEKLAHSLVEFVLNDLSLFFRKVYAAKIGDPANVART